MVQKKWQFYLNLFLIGFLALGVFSLSLKVLADNSWERLDFYNLHQVKLSPEKDVNQNEKIEDEKIKPASFGIKNTYKLPILMYHYISLPPKNSALPGLYLDPKIFAEQLEIINSAGYHNVFMSELPELINKKDRGQKYIALSFDDAYEDFYTQAWPRLKEANIKSTLYVIINKLDQPGYISRAQLKELAQSQLVEIGSHTFNHPNLQNLDDKKAEYEIKASRQALSILSGQNITSFAYPFGLYKTNTLEIVRRAGYSNAASTRAGSQQELDNFFSLRRLRPNSRQGEDFHKWLNSWQ